MDTKPKRRWFQFSLRTLFVAVTVLCVWLGYQVNWIRQRRELLAEVEQFYLSNFGRSAGVIQGGQSPRGLWLFGEPGVKQIDVWIVIGDHEERRDDTAYPAWQRAQLLFPEAHVSGLTITERQVRQLPKNQQMYQQPRH